MTKYTQEEHEAMRRSVEQLFRDVASRFEHAAVRADLPGPTGRPGLIRLSCSLPGTATVRALAGADQVDLHVGESTWIEVIRGRRNPAKLLDQVGKVVEDVVSGRFHERVHLRKVRYQPYG